MPRGGVVRPEEREQPSIVDADALQALFGALRDRGCTVVGPTVRDGAIVIDELPSAAALSYGALLRRRASEGPQLRSGGRRPSCGQPMRRRSVPDR
jgi:hypothetical protein